MGKFPGLYFTCAAALSVCILRWLLKLHEGTSNPCGDAKRAPASRKAPAGLTPLQRLRGHLEPLDPGRSGMAPGGIPRNVGEDEQLENGEKQRGGVREGIFLIG